MNIRKSTPDDLAAICSLYPAVFPDEDLLPLVKDLLPATETVLSLVAEVDGNVVGHVAFSKCGLEEKDAAYASRMRLSDRPLTILGGL